MSAAIFSGPWCATGAPAADAIEVAGGVVTFTHAGRSVSHPTTARTWLAASAQVLTDLLGVETAVVMALTWGSNERASRIAETVVMNSPDAGEWQWTVDQLRSCADWTATVNECARKFASCK